LSPSRPKGNFNGGEHFVEQAVSRLKNGTHSKNHSETRKQITFYGNKWSLDFTGHRMNHSLFLFQTAAGRPQHPGCLAVASPPFFADRLSLFFGLLSGGFWIAVRKPLFSKRLYERRAQKRSCLFKPRRALGALRIVDKVFFWPIRLRDSKRGQGAISVVCFATPQKQVMVGRRR